MRSFWIQFRKELESYLYSPTAWIAMVLFLAMMGGSFLYMLKYLTRGVGVALVFQKYFASLFFWLANLMVAPLITMRSFSEEYRMGTMELVLTTPVKESTVVLSKYFAALFFYGLMWVPTLVYPWILVNVNPDAQILLDLPTLASSYLGCFLVGALYIAVGVCCSSFTRNQMVAAMCTFGILFGHWLFSLAPSIATLEWVRDTAQYFSSVEHMMDFTRGVMDSRAFLFYGSSVLFFLFVCQRNFETRRWR